jgi:hypothetical protein
MAVTDTLEGDPASTYRFFTRGGRHSAIFGDVRREQIQLMDWNYKEIRRETMTGDSRRGIQNGYMIRDGIR